MKSPPHVEVGMPVWWYPDGDRHQEPHAGVVTKVGAHSLCVSIFDSQSYTLRIRDGVRHIDDAEANPYERHESGCWDHTPLVRKLLALAAEAPVKVK